MSNLVVASAGNVVVWMVWIVAGFACLASGVAVISFRNPFFSALALIGNLASLAVMYLLLSAEFVAAAQVLVYAGAVVVMFLFVIAYVGPRRRGSRGRAARAGRRSARSLAAGALLVEVVVAVALAGERQPLGHDGKVGPVFGSPAWIGRLFLVDHLLAFEITSVVLLIAAVGGVILGSHAKRATALMHGPSIAWYLVARRVPVRDRRARRAHPAQPAHRPALARADAERRESRADRLLAALRTTARARSSGSP